MFYYFLQEILTGKGLNDESEAFAYIQSVVQDIESVILNIKLIYNLFDKKRLIFQKNPPSKMLDDVIFYIEIGLFRRNE